jgi:hypothetical protein
MSWEGVVSQATKADEIGYGQVSVHSPLAEVLVRLMNAAFMIDA